MVNSNKGNMWLVIVVVVALLAGGVYYFSSTGTEPTMTDDEMTNGADSMAAAMVGASVVTEGEYAVDATASTFTWDAKKPLIEGYVDSGTISLKEGMIMVGTSTADGSFTVDMTTITVGHTAKEGKETALESHLKSKDFFEVEKYPETEFVIMEVMPTATSNVDFTYTVKGNLTMKGTKNEISFPAKIYLKDGTLNAEATVEIDRTKFGITYGSGSFFDNLADNAISDIFTLSFHLVATKSGAVMEGDAMEQEGVMEKGDSMTEDPTEG